MSVEGEPKWIGPSHAARLLGVARQVLATRKWSIVLHPRQDTTGRTIYRLDVVERVAAAIERDRAAREVLAREVVE